MQILIKIQAIIKILDIEMLQILKRLVFSLKFFFGRVVGLGNKTVFWRDCLCDVISLNNFRNVYAIDVNMECLFSDRIVFGADLVPYFS